MSKFSSSVLCNTYEKITEALDQFRKKLLNVFLMIAEEKEKTFTVSLLQVSETKNIKDFEIKLRNRHKGTIFCLKEFVLPQCKFLACYFRVSLIYNNSSLHLKKTKVRSYDCHIIIFRNLFPSTTVKKKNPAFLSFHL